MGNTTKTKKIIPAIIIVVLFFAQISFPYQTFGAEKLNWNNPTKGGAPAFKFNAGNISSAMVSAIGCTNVVEKMVKTVGSVAANIAKTKAKRVAERAATKTLKATGVAAGATSTNPAGTMAGQSISDWLRETLSDVTAKKTTDPELKEQNAAAIARNECLNGVAVNLARKQLVEMTRTTMQWVNTGFNGDPLYVRNVNKLMNSIENEVLEAELKLFKDPKNVDKYPFGRDYVRSVINAKNTQNDFAKSMISDLSVFLNFRGKEVSPNNAGYIESYTKDFSMGGWSAWLGLTQRPQNNPLGSTLAMTNNLDEKVENEKKYVKSETEANGGMLSQKKCVAYGINKKKADEKGNEGWLEDELLYAQGLINEEDICTEWEVVTPGSLIKDKVSQHLNSPEVQTEMVKTVNDLLFGLFSSLITNFQEGGLSSLKPTASKSDFDYGLFGGYGSNISGDYIPSTYEEKESEGGWVNGEPPDLTKDLPFIISTQKEFIEQANIYVKKYSEKIPALGKLDYCIPGPNASWKENIIDAKDAYADYVGSIFSKKMSLSGDDNDYTTVNTALRDPYQRIIEKSDLFPIIEISPFFYIIRERLGKTFKESAVSARAELWATYVKNIDKEYTNKIDATYGPNSPMQTPLNIDENGTVLGENTSYLPMAQMGLSLTKNLKEEGEGLETLQKEYKEYVTEVNINLYRLEKMKKEINGLMKEATEAREKARKEAGLDPIGESCLLKEEVSYLGNE